MLDLFVWWRGIVHFEKYHPQNLFTAAARKEDCSQMQLPIISFSSCAAKERTSFQGKGSKFKLFYPLNGNYIYQLAHFNHWCSKSKHRMSQILCNLANLPDLPANYEVDEGTNHRRAPHPLDVFVMVKEYISSVDLAQPPLLVLTHQHRSSFPLTILSHLGYFWKVLEGYFWKVLLKNVETKCFLSDNLRRDAMQSCVTEDN